MFQEEGSNERINILYDRIDELELKNQDLEKRLEILSNYIDEQEKKMKSFSFNDNTIIKLMYNMYLKGESFGRIASYLNENKIPTRRGGKWGLSSVSFILKNSYNMKKLLTEEERTRFYHLIAKNTRNKNITTKK